ncbi:MAG: hypothetical protein ACO1RT_00015, partial [Planctomycetaceae bacterium]
MAGSVEASRFGGWGHYRLRAYYARQAFAKIIFPVFLMLCVLSTKSLLARKLRCLHGFFARLPKLYVEGSNPFTRSWGLTALLLVAASGLRTNGCTGNAFSIRFAEVLCRDQRPATAKGQ